MITATIVNRKGGVCKTTVCRNLGYLLASKYGKRVLLVDLDSSGNLSDFFNVRRHVTDDTGAAAIVANMDEDPTKHIAETRIENLYVLPGNSTLGKAEVAIKLDDFNPQQFRLKNQLVKIENNFDYCLIDCPPTVSNAILVVNALACSNDVIIPCTADKDAIDGTWSMIPNIETVKGYNDKLAIRGIVLCRIGNRSIDKQLVQDFPFQGVPRFRTYIRESINAVERSRFEGKLLREWDPKCKEKATRDFENLAAEYVGAEFPYPDDVVAAIADFM